MSGKNVGSLAILFLFSSYKVLYKVQLSVVFPDCGKINDKFEKFT